MAVKLRLRRMGRKKRPYYRIVAADSRAPRDGRFIETIGTYNPLAEPYQIDIDEDRVFHWLNNGAQPTQTVRSLFRKKGVWLKWDLMKNGADEAKIAAAYAKWEVSQEERAKRLASLKEEKATVQEEENVVEEETEAPVAEQKSTEEVEQEKEPENE